MIHILTKYSHHGNIQIHKQKEITSALHLPYIPIFTYDQANTSSLIISPISKSQNLTFLVERQLTNFFLKNGKSLVETLFNRIKRLNINSLYLKFLIPKLKLILAHFQKRTLSQFMWHTFASQDKPNQTKTKTPAPKPKPTPTQTHIPPATDSLKDAPAQSFPHPRQRQPPEDYFPSAHIKLFIANSSQKFFKEWFFQNIKKKTEGSAPSLPKRKTRRSTRLKKLHDL